MRMTRIYIKGFKRFSQFELELNPIFNVIIGDNETGKSSLLEAIELVLTGKHEGRQIQYAIDPYLFNANEVADFFKKHLKGQDSPAPEILIEAYLESDNCDPELSRLKGLNNTKNEDCPGLKMIIEADKDNLELLKEYAANEANPAIVPVEFFQVHWMSFANNAISLKKLPFRVATIDTSRSHVYRGPYKYFSQIVNEQLDDAQKRELSLEYKRLKHAFSQSGSIKDINDYLIGEGNPATTKKVSIQMDLSSRATWESEITLHLDNLPLDCAGKGEQCCVQLRCEIARSERSQIILIEEPENHLSYSKLSRLLDCVQMDCADRQVIATTHSGFVLNKLGIDNLKLVSHAGQTAVLADLSPDTKDYFMKLPGYDTLRLILSPRSILVEGPSDELVVQRAYYDRHEKMPLQNGVDVISVGSLAFERFLEIAKLLELDVSVVTDNDGDVERLKGKYSDYFDPKNPNIQIFYDEDKSCPSLEQQLLNANSLGILNDILEVSYSEEGALLKHMRNNKTDCALKLFKSDLTWSAPEYIKNAIERE